jgi:hypothetical protein
MNRTIKNGSHRQKNALILELMDLYCHTADDLDYEKAVANGSWPTAMEIMERRLKPLREKEMLRILEK